ncbi:DNA primase [Streptomyces swartbergensis]|uniref:DNA primase n=1 Tax=Streptomyces swartbergensis TaxID=487165 RepID=A0A243SC99_9ACTN|nr:DNA primase [Streptomyces swartbergensis]OUD04996.1 DNA primase [Streptomyces swartbergensis]
MNRVGLGLAVGAGYLLGRTKKLKMAVAVGGLVAGKKMNLSPRMVADLVQQQLRNNPQFKEIGDQLRQDLRGVGKAASGAMVERQLDAVADRLHSRTAQVRDQLSGVVPGTGDTDAEEPEDTDAEEPEDTEDEEPEDSGPEEEDEEPEPAPQDAAKKAPAKKAPAKQTAKQASAKKAPARKAPAKKTAGRKGAAKKTTAAKKATSAGNRGGSSRTRLPKGGGEG